LTAPASGQILLSVIRVMESSHMSTARRTSVGACAPLLSTLLPAIPGSPRAASPAIDVAGDSGVCQPGMTELDGPLLLQDRIPNGGPMTVMRFRNIWFRAIPPGK
jgi:hypothetical protein